MDTPADHTAIKECLGQLIVHHTGAKVEKLSLVPVAGGCINQTFKVISSAGNFFVKLNSAARFPGMFQCEADALRLLAATATLRVPEVLAKGQCGDTAFILLELINPARPGVNFWENFGSRLAALHQTSAAKFGFEHDNYIGSLSQSNKFHSTWAEFFIAERLEPMITLARRKRLMPADTEKQFTRFYKHLPSVFPPEKPSLIHGDLWSGNYMADENGEPCAIDPAIYFGCREMDIAMSKLFGGFDQGFYIAYDQVLPLEKGWRERIDLCNLYPLLVHLNLFGSSYLSEIRRIVSAF